MARFYKDLAGGSARDALRAASARSSAIHARTNRLLAPFVLVGDWR